jgi:hypothetical protein
VRLVDGPNEKNNENFSSSFFFVPRHNSLKEKQPTNLYRPIMNSTQVETSLRTSDKIASNSSARFQLVNVVVFIADGPSTNISSSCLAAIASSVERITKDVIASFCEASVATSECSAAPTQSTTARKRVQPAKPVAHAKSTRHTVSAKSNTWRFVGNHVAPVVSGRTASASSSVVTASAVAATPASSQLPVVAPAASVCQCCEMQHCDASPMQQERKCEKQASCVSCDSCSFSDSSKSCLLGNFLFGLNHTTTTTTAATSTCVPSIIYCEIGGICFGRNCFFLCSLSTRPYVPGGLQVLPCVLRVLDGAWCFDRCFNGDDSSNYRFERNIERRFESEPQSENPQEKQLQSIAHHQQQQYQQRWLSSSWRISNSSFESNSCYLYRFANKRAFDIRPASAAAAAAAAAASAAAALVAAAA